MADISKITLPDGNTYDFKDPVARVSIPFGQVDSTSTATVFTATIPGITEYYDGLTIMLKNGVVTSASGFTININGLGAKHAYSNMAAATAETTLFNVNYTMLFVYDSTRVEGGGWICYRGYDANTNTIGYQLRTNSSTRPAADKFYRYRILFESADGKKWVPSNTSTSTNATASRNVNQRPINPFGDIVYYGATTVIEANANVGAASLWQQYTMTLGYAFNRTGAELVLPYPSPIYIKCAPQSDGSAIIDADNPYVFDLPSTDDGKIYIYLGRTSSATTIELVMVHPIYYFKNSAIHLWTNSTESTTIEPATATPVVDGTATVGTSVKYAREDHVHPTDATRQAALVSGTNIKTVNGSSLLGSGNLAVGSVTQVTAGTGLSIGSTSNGSITTSGTINHTNAVTAQDTQAFYPIKIDAQGHISGYGTAITPLTSSSTLDATKLDGIIPTSCLPSYVDDVLQYVNKASFPTTGQTGKIYVDTSTNLTWRWGGSAYVQISPSLALGTTSSTAYRGDYGNTAYTHATDTNRSTTAATSGLYKIATTAQGHVAAVTSVQKSDITALGVPSTNTTYSISITNNVITLTGSDGSTSTVTLPVYAGGITPVYAGGVI